MSLDAPVSARFIRLGAKQRYELREMAHRLDVSEAEVMRLALAAFVADDEARTRGHRR